MHAIPVMTFVHEASHSTMSQVMGASLPVFIDPDAWENMISPVRSTATAITPEMAGFGDLVSESIRAMALSILDCGHMIWGQ